MAQKELKVETQMGTPSFRYSSPNVPSVVQCSMAQSVSSWLSEWTCMGDTYWKEFMKRVIISLCLIDFD